jgi:hypothetical protein
MASTDEMLRLVRHAVLKLDQARQAYRTSSVRPDPDLLMSMTYASAILGMVGACMMDDEPDPDEATTLRGLVADFVDPDPCDYDHNGYCQAHSLHGRPCPHERAKTLLEASK